MFASILSEPLKNSDIVTIGIAVIVTVVEQSH